MALHQEKDRALFYPAPGYMSDHEIITNWQNRN